MATAKKWEIDDIISPEAKKDAEPFTCSVCLGIWCDPVQTSCHHIFCKGCVAESSTVCPFCRTSIAANGLQPLEKVNQFVLRMLNNLKVQCPYHKPVPVKSKEPLEKHTEASTPGRAGKAGEPPLTRRRLEPRPAEEGSVACDWTGSFADLSRHLAACPCCVLQCPRGCGEELLRRQLAEHEQDCKRNWSSCEICGQQVRPWALAEHNQKDAERHVQVLQKRLKDVGNAAVMEELTSFQQSLFLSQAQINAQLAKLQAVKPLSNDAVWLIQDPAGMLRDFGRNASKSSPRFSLGGLEVWLCLFPNGKEGAAPGKFSLFLHCAVAGWSLKWAVKTSGGEERQHSHDFKVPEGRGSINWGNIHSIPLSGDFRIEVKLLSMAQLVL